MVKSKLWAQLRGDVHYVSFNNLILGSYNGHQV